MSAAEERGRDRLVLIDTSAWIEALSPEGGAGLRESVQHLIASGRAATCEVVIAEVLRGAEDGPAAARLERGLGELLLLPCDGMGATAAAMGRELRAPRNGFADLLIAAVAFEQGALILTRDRHLSRIADVFEIDEVMT